MYMERIPTYIVTIEYHNGERDISFRVPKNHLDEFLYVVNFNDWADSFRVEREPDPWDIGPTEYEEDGVAPDEYYSPQDDGVESPQEESPFDPSFINEQRHRRFHLPAITGDDARSAYDNVWSSNADDSPVKACYCPLGTNHPDCCINRAIDKVQYGGFEILVVDG